MNILDEILHTAMIQELDENINRILNIKDLEYKNKK